MSTTTTTTKSVKSVKKANKVKSAYGTGVELLCKNPNMDSAKYWNNMKKRGFDIVKNKAAIQTAWNQVRCIVKHLRANKLMD